VRLLYPPAVPALSTGLTGAGHRFDQCGTGSKPCKFPLCVLVCFGSEGCVLVPRSSGTPVATWAWPTWVVRRRRVLEATFVLLESSCSSRRFFISSRSLPPLRFAVSVLQKLAMDVDTSTCNETWELESGHSPNFHQTLDDHGYVTIQIERNN
jgi:hypothetical protein